MRNPFRRKACPVTLVTSRHPFSVGDYLGMGGETYKVVAVLSRTQVRVRKVTWLDRLLSRVGRLFNVSWGNMPWVR